MPKNKADKVIKAHGKVFATSGESNASKAKQQNRVDGGQAAVMAGIDQMLFF